MKNFLNEDEELFGFLKGKKVALIGPAPTLEGSNLGSYIDSFDIVCRINHSLLIPEDLIKDYGLECEILFHNCNPHTVFHHLLNDLDEYTPPYLCCVGKKNTPLFNREKSFELFVDYPTHFYHAGDRFFEELTKTIGHTSPDTGIGAMAMLVSSEIESLFIGGFSFYRTERPYYNGHIDTGVVSKYAQVGQIDYFKKIYEENKSKIDVDEFISYHILGNKFTTKSNKRRLEEFKNGEIS